MNSWWIAYLCIASLALLANLIAIISSKLLLPSTSTAGTTKLLFLIQISSFIQILTNLPVIYTHNSSLCKSMSFFHYYSGLVNTIAILLLAFVYRNFVTGHIDRNHRSLPHWRILLLLFPILPPLLPLLVPSGADSYGDHGSVWCSLAMSGASDRIWAWIVFYLFIILALIITAIVLVISSLPLLPSSIYCCFSTTTANPSSIPPNAASSQPSPSDISAPPAPSSWSPTASPAYRRLFFVLSGYILAYWLSFFPRLFPRFLRLFFPFSMNNPEQFFSCIGTPLAGMIYAASFLKNWKMFVRIEQLVAKATEVELGGSGGGGWGGSSGRSRTVSRGASRFGWRGGVTLGGEGNNLSEVDLRDLLDSLILEEGSVSNKSGATSIISNPFFSSDFRQSEMINWRGSGNNNEKKDTLI